MFGLVAMMQALRATGSGSTGKLLVIQTGAERSRIITLIKTVWLWGSKIGPRVDQARLRLA